jgi:hypothetical protein
VTPFRCDEVIVFAGAISLFLIMLATRGSAETVTDRLVEGALKMFGYLVIGVIVAVISIGILRCVQ